MNKEELLKAIMDLPKTETNNLISSMNSINVDDLMSAVDRLNKVPDYNDLLKENKRLKDNWNKLKEYLNYKSERAVGEDEYVYDEIYNEMQELESGYYDILL